MFSLKMLNLTQFTFCERPTIFGGEIIYLINISMPLNHPKVVLKSQKLDCLFNKPLSGEVCEKNKSLTFWP